MDTYDHNEQGSLSERPGVEPQVILAESVPEPLAQTDYRGNSSSRRHLVLLPILLFIATCLTTLGAGTYFAPGVDGWVGALLHGLTYAVPVMTILVCHEAGHFLQNRRYGVASSLPYFLPVPFGPLGTFGAVIVMDSRMRNRRALFDIGISGPLAGLAPTLIFCVLGLYWSSYAPGHDQFGDPLLLKWLAHWILGPRPPGQVILCHPMAFAAWVGLLITALNLIPIGQLDGGHVLYALLRHKAHRIAALLLLAAAAAVIVLHYYSWSLMLVLLFLMGPIHPPTADDHVPLGIGRLTLGWLTLAFIPIGFTPTPFLDM